MADRNKNSALHSLPTKIILEAVKFRRAFPNPESDNGEGKPVKIALISSYYFINYRDTTMREIVLKEPRNYGIEFVNQNDDREYISEFQSTILEKIDGNQDIVIYLGIADFIDIVDSDNPIIKGIIYMLEVAILFKKIKEKINGKQGGKIIVVGLLPLLPGLNRWTELIDAMHYSLSDLAYSNPDRVGFRGFDRTQFDPSEMYENDEHSLTQAGEIKVGTFFREIFETLVENRDNPRPLNDWPIFKLPERN